MSVPRPNFRMLVRGFEVQVVAEELALRADLWDLITVRQKYEGTAHADTQAIILRGPTTLEGLFDNLDAQDFPQLQELPATLELIHSVASFLKTREVGRVMLARLNAAGTITAHVDEGAYARYFARFHVPITTNPACAFFCGGERVRMGRGELWWFNHQVSHRVENFGPARTHLILDAAAPGFTGALESPSFPGPA